MRSKLSSFFGLLIVTFSGCCFCHTTNAQVTEEYTIIRTGLEQVYNRQYDSASLSWRSLSSPVMKQILSAFSARWQYTPIAHSANKETYILTLTKVVEQLETSQTLNYGLYMHIIAEMLQAEFHYYSGNSFQALWHARRAYPLMMRIFDEKREDSELLFIKGMYLYYMDFFRNLSFVYRTALLPLRDGDQKKGLELLAQVSQTESIASTEALIYLAHIYLHLENKPERSLPYTQQLTYRYPANHKFREMEIENFIALKKYDDAAKLLTVQLAVTNTYYKVTALYLSGQLLHLTGDKNKAIQRLRDCTQLAEKHSIENDFVRRAGALLNDLED